MKEDHQEIGVWYEGPDRAELATQEEALGRLFERQRVRLSLRLSCYFKAGPNVIVDKPKFLWSIYLPQGATYELSAVVREDSSGPFGPEWYVHCYGGDIDKWKPNIIDAALKWLGGYKERLARYMEVADTCVQLMNDAMQQEDESKILAKRGRKPKEEKSEEEI